MANMCNSSFVFEGSKEQLEEFAGILQRVTASEESEWGQMDNLAAEFGASFEQTGDTSVVGKLLYFTQKDDSVQVDFNTKWRQPIPLVNKICERFDSFTFEVMAEEFGNGVCVNTDTEGKYFSEKYAIVGPNEDIYIDTEEELLEKLEELTGNKFESYEEVISDQWLQDSEFNVYKFKPDLSVF